MSPHPVPAVTIEYVYVVVVGTTIVVKDVMDVRVD